MKQQGSSLVIVLVMLLVLMLGALAAVRSTETTALTAGNSAFRMATRQVADVGINTALATISATSFAPDTAVANQYFNMRQVEDVYGMPSTVDWSKVAKTTVQNYNVQYVVERLCSVATVTDPVNQCVTDSQPASGSNKLGNDPYVAPSTIAYRVTVRTTGPKNAESYTQALLSK
jgi:type IV pilus assembly protein PilX